MVKPSKPRRKRSIDILGVKIKIKYVKELLCDGDDILHGAFDSDSMTIFISEDSDIKSTILHECAHALLYISGCSQRMTRQNEEACVMAIEYALRDYFVF